MIDLNKLYSTNYFDVVVNAKQNSDKKIWIGEALIKRKDTGEEVRGGCVQYSKSSDGVTVKLKRELEKLTKFLSTAPNDWNSRARKLLVRHLKSGQMITNFAFFLQKKAGEIEDVDKLIDDFVDICSKLESNVIETIKEIEQMTERERLELLTSDDTVYSDPNDPWNLDDLTARNLIFNCFINPSEEEIDRHRIHQNRIRR